MTKFFLLAFIGGSGIYQIEELKNQKWINVSTPWGPPSDKILTGTVDEIKFYFYQDMEERIYIIQVK